MNSQFDYNIISDFLSPSFRERVIYELSSPKKRDKAYERFSHDVERIIEKKYIYYQDSIIDDTIKSEIKKSARECTVLSFDYPQGKSMSIEEAFDYLTNEYMFAVLVAYNWLIIKPEHEGGKGLLYVLRKE